VCGEKGKRPSEILNAASMGGEKRRSEKSVLSNFETVGGEKNAGFIDGRSAQEASEGEGAVKQI